MQKNVIRLWPALDVFSHRRSRSGPDTLTKILLVMKLTTFLLTAFLLQVQAAGKAQSVTLSGRDIPLKQVLKVIKQQTGYMVFGNSELLKTSKPVSLSVKDMPLNNFLDFVCGDQSMNYRIDGKTIVLFAKPPVVAAPEILRPLEMAADSVRGQVLDDEGKPIAAVTVHVRGGQGVTTDTRGRFALAALPENAIIDFTAVGFAPLSIRIQNGYAFMAPGSRVLQKEQENPSKLLNNTLNNVLVKLSPATSKLNEVTISTGIFTRNKESFTGATATYRGDDLKAVGNRNILQSLKTLDPSFIIVENNSQGANPNVLPNIELRGKTSVTTLDVNSQFASDPNLPLFIMDGFESDLQTINNLDINRVQSITILKDAASTAIYGSKAANGVVVVETKRPQSGKLIVSYTNDLTVEAPDLSSYNMMNASEKLQFEKLAGLYTSSDAATQYTLDQQYNAKLQLVKQGLNTYWMNEPVRTGISDGHSLNFTGGSNELLFNAGISYKDQEGVMKNSGRKSLGANIDINYRKGRINVMNSLYISGYTANNSNYGSFADYVNSSPYYIKRNPDGTYPEFLDESWGTNYTFGSTGNYTRQVYNPLYNAALGGINQEKNQAIQNNLRAIVDIASGLRLQGGLQVRKGITTDVQFIPPGNTTFDGTPALQKGSYNNQRNDQTGYNGNLMLTYAKVLNSVHQVNVNLRTEINEDITRLLGLSAVGFPDGSNGNPAFAYSYTPYSTPSAASQINRSTAFLGSASYAYKLRYLLDASLNRSGSDAFGSNNKYSTSWDLGLGWNLHHENFLKGAKWLDLLKLSANIGRNGNQQLGVFTSSSVYTNIPKAYLFGSALDVTGFGNPGLQWQNTVQRSAWLDFAALNNRVSAQFNYYVKRTDPLVVGADGSFFPPSFGITSAYPINLGTLTVKGWEATLRVSPVYDVKNRIVWTIAINGSANRSTFGHMTNALDEWNKEQQNSQSLVRYKDGYSPDDIWAVRSLGIDPATGMELFQKKDGTITNVYNANDIVRIGTSRPDVQGVLSTTLNYKSFNLGINLRYSVNNEIMNTALYNKVENISLQGLRFNQDKRALYDRWQKPGDIAQFKAINITEYTPVSSRFMEKESYLSGESFSLGWRFFANSWIKMLHLQTMDLRLYANDLFRLSDIRSERGTDYPFSHSASFSVNVSF